MNARTGMRRGVVRRLRHAPHRALDKIASAQIDARETSRFPGTRLDRILSERVVDEKFSSPANRRPLGSRVINSSFVPSLRALLVHSEFPDTSRRGLTTVDLRDCGFFLPSTHSPAYLTVNMPFVRRGRTKRAVSNITGE